MGIPEGSILKYINTDDEVRVVSHRMVEFKGKKMSLTLATRNIMGIEYYPAPSSRWLYEGEILLDAYNRTYERDIGSLDE